MSDFEVEVIAASVRRDTGKRLLTLALKYPRWIHGELLTHRTFSRNAMSSRAVPVRRILSQVWNNPAEPVHWGANNSGMQSKSQLTGWRLWLARKLWRGAAKAACIFAWTLMRLGGHKQWVNRILEPWQWMVTIVTSSEWDNFFSLRTHPDAQPEFQRLAYMILLTYRTASYKPLEEGQWHIPYWTEVDESEALSRGLSMEERCMISAARCARVSYLTHDGRRPNVAEDLKLFNRLAGSIPLHASPLEHQATPGDTDTGNFQEWSQFRKLWERKVENHDF